MQRYRLTLKPESAFATPLVGDTLFGQLCWALRFRFGEARLNECLQGYTQGKPFMVVSDAMPAGYVPMPCLPLSWLTSDILNTKARKQLKKRRWLPSDELERSAEQWLERTSDSGEPAWQRTEIQPRNSISRLLNTTDGGEFAPYTEERNWYAVRTQLELILVLDEARLSLDECRRLFTDVGLTGYGKNATIGNGQFSVMDITPSLAPGHSSPNAYLTLAPSTPQGGEWQTEYCFYQTLVWFGRHGAQAVHTGSPFKAPVVFAATGAVLFPHQYNDVFFVGKGVGGAGQLSKALPATVTQGYAPVVGIHVPLPQGQVA